MEPSPEPYGIISDKHTMAFKHLHQLHYHHWLFLFFISILVQYQCRYIKREATKTKHSQILDPITKNGSSASIVPQKRRNPEFFSKLLDALSFQEAD